MCTSSGSSANSSANGFPRRLETAAEVEPHGVLRWRRRHDHVGVAGGAGDLVELLAQTSADARRTERRADVEECELRGRWSQVRHHHADADQPFTGERAERDPSRVDVVLEGVHLGRNGVLAVTVRIPRRRVPLTAPREQIGAVLVVEHVDAFRAVDRDDERQLGAAQPPELDRRFHRLTLAPRRPPLSPES